MPAYLSTLIWEILNFLVIVFVLYKLLYKPLRRFIRERQQHIDDQKRAAAEARSSAEAMRQEYEQKRQELADQEKRILAEARARADEEAAAIVEKARNQARASREAAARRIEQRIEQTADALRDQVTEAALALVARVAASGGAESVHAAAIAEVDRLLGEVSEEERRRAGEMLSADGGAVPVAAAPPLNESQTQQLVDVLKKRLGVGGVTVNASDEPDLIAGVEVRLKNLLVKAHWRDRLERLAVEPDQPDGGQP